MLLCVVHLARQCDFGGRHARRTAPSSAAGSGRRQPGERALPNEIALELGQGAKDMEDELAARRGGIDVFLQTAEADVAPLELGDGVDEMAQRAPQSIEFPDDQRVARSQVVEDPGQLRTFVEGATGGVHKQAVAASRAKRVELQVGVLIGGGYPRGSRAGAAWRGSVSETVVFGTRASIARNSLSGSTADALEPQPQGS